MARTAAATVALLACATAWALDPEPTPELVAERDKLLEKIIAGQDYEASVKRFAALVKQRDAAVATSRAALEEERRRHEAERAGAQARRAWMETYRQTGDYEVSWRCTLAADPKNPPPSREGRFRADWGQVTRKETVRLPPKNALDDGEQVTMFEVAGQADTYWFRGDTFGPKGQPLAADPGDLVLVCRGGTTSRPSLPGGWGTRPHVTGFALRIAEPPLVARKAKWNPIHVTSSAFFWAIHDVKWVYPPGSFLLSNIVIAKDLGGGRYEIEADRKSWILEVPPSLKHRELLQPGRAVWAILGEHRFDRELKTLVLKAQDLEPRCILER